MTGLSRTRALALAGIVGPIWSATVIALQGALQPEYSHVKMPISALAALPLGWMQNLNFYVTGVLVMDTNAQAVRLAAAIARRAGAPAR